MKWKHKAAIMRVASLMPLGDFIYEQGQKIFGRLKADPMARMTYTVNILRALKDKNILIKDKVLFEVGTGHIPLIPIIFFLTGAKTIYSYDLNRRLQYRLLQEVLAEFTELKSELWGHLSDFVDRETFENRFSILERYKSEGVLFLSNANITYVAPGDAASSGLQDRSIDVHFSCTVFEHIPGPIISSIMREAHRILKPSGFAIHLIDPSDHFQHQDRMISRINFLQYNENEWAKIAGNQFAYCNRLRYPQLRSIFEDTGFELLSEIKHLDANSLEVLQQGFDLDAAFKEFSPEELCTIGYDVLLKPR